MTKFVIFISGLCLVAAGCNADPSCRRETALLRAEMLDLEDKYYLMKSQRDEALGIARGVDGSRVASEVLSADQQIGSGVIIYDEPIDGDMLDAPVINEGQLIDDNSPPKAPPSARELESITPDPIDGVPADDGSGVLAKPTASSHGDPAMPSWRPVR